MGWNVLYDRYGWLGDDAMGGITAAVDAERPDVLCVQEHYRDPDPEAFPVQAPMRRAVGGVEKAPVYLHEVWARGKAGRRFGVSTFSRHPIVGRADISFGTTSNNACAVTDIAWAGDTVRVFNAHFASLHFGSQEYAALQEGVPDAEGGSGSVPHAGGPHGTGDPGWTGDGRSGPEAPPCAVRGFQ